MVNRNEIKKLFESLNYDEQTQLLTELLQEQELQGKVIESATEEVLIVRGKKPCPHCQSEKVYKRGKQNNVQMYQCRACNKWYSETTGTPLWDIKLKHKWQSYLRCMEQGKSLKVITKELDISIQTSFDWRHKILSSLSKFVPEQLGGEIECDELELAISEKGKRDLNRAPRMRGTDFKRNQKKQDITVVQVVTAKQRQGDIYLRTVESQRLTTEQIQEAFGERIQQGSVLMTDSHHSYKSFAKTTPGITHKNFIAKDHVNKEDKNIHVQSVNYAHKQIRAFLKPFNGVSSKYLQNYMNWYAYRDKLKDSKQTIKQWVITGLTANGAYELFCLFKENAVLIRV